MSKANDPLKAAKRALERIANESYLGISADETVKRLRVIAKKALEELNNKAAEAAEKTEK